jgi:heme-degrading monooxygenase HmoA
MPVTEFAILPLTHPLTEENSTLPSAVTQKLQTAKSVLEQASKYKFHFFQQIEDPSTIYIIGKWDSPETHYAFLPSAKNQKLLELFKEDVHIEEKDGKKMQMWHLDHDVLDIPSGAESVFKAPIISCNRHFVPKEKKTGFNEKFSEVRGLLEDFTKPYDVVGGLRIEREDEEKEEWVLFSGFRSVDNHMEFAKTKGFEKYREIVGFVSGFEVKHLRAVGAL